MLVVLFDPSMKNERYELYEAWWFSISHLKAKKHWKDPTGTDNAATYVLL